MSRIGIFGHSLGGSTAVEVMRLERRLQAGISLDGGEYGKMFRSDTQQLERPFMVVAQEQLPPPSKLLYQRLTNDAYRLILKGSKHNTFTDFGLMRQWLRANSTKVDPPIQKTRLCVRSATSNESH